MIETQDLVTRLRKRAEIRRSIKTRKSVQQGKPDRISDLLEEAAEEIEKLNANNLALMERIGDLGWQISAARELSESTTDVRYEKW